MTLAALGGIPGPIMGFASVQGYPVLNAGFVTNLNMSSSVSGGYFLGQIWNEDGASHTIDTTGSSSFGFYSGNCTHADPASTAIMGICDIGTAAGPPGRPIINGSNLAQFDVSRSFTGAAPVMPSLAWANVVPNAGTKTIAHGQLICFGVQLINRASADTLQLRCMNIIGGPAWGLTLQSGGGTTWATNGGSPSLVITYSDGTRGYFVGGCVFSSLPTTQTWNNTSGTKEYGNVFQVPVPSRIYGVGGCWQCTADMDIILYSDPFGTPVAEKTYSLVGKQLAGSSGFGQTSQLLFATPFDAAANTNYAVIVKPTSATNVLMNYKSFDVAAHQITEIFGTTSYAINRNTGAFAAQNSQKDRFTIGPIVSAFSDGSGGAVPSSFGFG